MKSGSANPGRAHTGLSFLVVALLLSSGCAEKVNLRHQPHRLTHGIISLNFDDGYECVYRNAVPLLKKAGIPATFYVITSTYKQNAPDYMKAREIQDLAAQGNEIGVHTRTHPHLPAIEPRNLELEIRGARDDLKDLGIHAKTFAYPYGDYDQGVIKSVQANGFSGARTTEPTFNDRSTNPFMLRRFEVHSRVTFLDVKREIDEAESQGLWLILLFHRVDETGDHYYNAHPELFREIVDYLVAIHAHTVTTDEGLRITGLAR